MFLCQPYVLFWLPLYPLGGQKEPSPQNDLRYRQPVGATRIAARHSKLCYLSDSHPYENSEIAAALGTRSGEILSHSSYYFLDEIRLTIPLFVAKVAAKPPNDAYFATVISREPRYYAG
jgi:hypothetical protein